MNYFELVKTILETAKKHKYIEEVNYGDIYEFNNQPTRKYSNFSLFCQSCNDSGDTTTYTFVAYVTDRLLDDSSNKLEVQSLSKTILEQILAECFDSLDSTTYTFWTEKFNDLCAGCYVTFSVTLPKELICVDDDLFKKVVKEINENGTYNVQFVDEVVVDVPQAHCKLQELSDTIKVNHTTQTYYPQDGYDGIEKMTVNVEVPDPKLQMKQVQLTDSTPLLVNPDEGYDGIKQLSISQNLQIKSINANGTYRPDKGYNGISDVMVNVPEPKSVELNTTITENNKNLYFNPEDYEADYFNQANIEVAIPTETKTANLSDSLFVDTTTLTPTTGYNYSKVTLNNDLGLTIEDQDAVDLGGVELNLTELLGLKPDADTGEWIVTLQMDGHPITDTEATILKAANRYHLRWNETDGFYTLSGYSSVELPDTSPFILKVNLNTGEYEYNGEIGELGSLAEYFAPFYINYQGLASQLYFNSLLVECDGETICSLKPKKITVANATYYALLDEASGNIIYSKVLRPKELLPFTIINLDVYDNIKEIDYNDYPIDDTINPRYMVGETKLQKVTLGSFAPTTLQKLCWNNANYLTWLDVTEMDCSNVTSCNGAIGTKHTKLLTVIGDHTLEEVEAGKIVAFKNLGTKDLDYYQLEGPSLRYASLLAIVNGLADRTGKTQQAFRISQEAYNKCLNDDGTTPASDILTTRQNTLVSILTEKNYSIEYKK